MAEGLRCDLGCCVMRTERRGPANGIECVPVEVIGSADGRAPKEMGRDENAW
jgi:hypothetical protein